MKFRAPSPSEASIASGPAQSTRAQTRSATAQAEPVDQIASTQAKPRKPHVTSRRARAHKLDKAKAAVKDAAKRAKRTKQLVEPCVAYVGNVRCCASSLLELLIMIRHKDRPGCG